ncbi:MAG TPA: hemolysin III family protein, partial [Thermoanaerobaculia bacterium]|nr:hemolysin III family protein [Thermoanaerobaculia bacterium]
MSHPARRGGGARGARRTVPRFSFAEEVAHGVSHGVGVALSIGGLAVLVAFAALRGSARHVVSAAIFGVTLVLLYTASTLYHSIPLLRAKRVLRILDHAAIYLLIAGTYTPFTLVTLRGPWGWSLFGVVWTAAIGG